MLLNCFYEEENSIFHFFLFHNLILVPKTIELNTRHYLIMKISSKTELQEIVWNNSSDIDVKDFVKLYRYYTKELFWYLAKDITVSSNNSLQFKKNLL